MYECLCMYIYIQVIYYIQTLSTALMARALMAIHVDGDGVGGNKNNSIIIILIIIIK